ncbi:hypothetical protein D3C85_624190 [compost metagenome]
MRGFTACQAGIDVFDDGRQIDDGVDQVVRARTFEHLDDTGAFFRQLVGGQRLVLFVGQTQSVAGARQRDCPHTGAAAFEDAGPGVVDLDASGDVADAQGNHVSQSLGGVWAAIGHFVGRYHVVGDVAIVARQFHHFFHDDSRITRTGSDFQTLVAQCIDGIQGARNQRRVQRDLLDLQWHETLVKRGDVFIGR